MLRRCIKGVWCVATVWATLCVTAFVLGPVIMLVGAPHWLPLPWSDFRDFVEGADGRVYIDISFYARVLCYDHDGRFIASYPFPYRDAKGSELAASADGRLFFCAQHHLYVYDSKWQKQSVTEGGRWDSADNWVLDKNGNPRFVDEDVRGQPVVNCLAKPGDRIFKRGRDRESFVCRDGSVLARRGNCVERHSPDGTLLTTYAAPMVLRPFAFPWPALLVTPYFLILAYLRKRKERMSKQSAPVDSENAAVNP
jgi:hypothetical protein